MCDMNVKIRQSDDFRVAVYARVSSDQQVEAGTIASQLEELKDRMAKETLKLEKELTFVDDGYSGATLVRPALERFTRRCCRRCN